MNFDSGRPIYLQLVEYIRKEIMSGTYQMGEKLPSVREFAMELEVNPNTIQKALAQLESDGLIYTKRNVGKFITEESRRITSEKEEQARMLTKTFIQEMKQLGFEKEEIRKRIMEELQ